MTDDTTTDETTRLKRELATQLRRLNEKLVLARPPADELAAAVERARAFADRLEELPQRDVFGEISEAALLPRDFLEHSPISGRSNAIAPPLTMRIVRDDDETHRIEGDVTFGAAYEGPPGHVHGGYIAAMFDEALGFAQLSSGFTGRLTIHYRSPTPLNVPLHLEAWIDSVTGRKRIIRGTCRSKDGTLLSEADGLFIAPRDDYLARLSGSAGETP